MSWRRSSRRSTPYRRRALTCRDLPVKRKAIFLEMKQLLQQERVSAGAHMAKRIAEYFSLSNYIDIVLIGIISKMY